MTKHTQKPINKTLAHLHDGVSPYTYLGVFYLKKFTALLSDNQLNEDQEKTLYLSFMNMQKAYENIGKLFLVEDAENLPQELFFPTLEEAVQAYPQAQIMLDNRLKNMASTISKRLGICVFELLLNQLKHNLIRKGRVCVAQNEKTIYARIVFEGAQPTVFEPRTSVGLGLPLMQQRLASWGGQLTLLPITKDAVTWEVALPAE